MRGGASETEEDGVSGLHGDEGAEGVVDCAVDESGDEAAPEEKDVGVCSADFGSAIDLAVVEEGSRRLGGFGLA